MMDVLGLMPDDKGGSKVVENVRTWMANRSADSPPAFVFVNFLEAHFPAHQLPSRFRNAFTDKSLSVLREYSQLAFGAQIGRHLSPAELNRIEQPLQDLYDGGILYTDYLLGQIIDIWRQRGTLDNTVFVVLGDHGEHVGEHKMHGHVLSMYQEDLSVPFMFRYPKRITAGKRVSKPVSTLGTFATLIDLLDMSPPKSVQWASLAPIMSDKTNEKFPNLGQPVISERYEKKLMSSRFSPGALNGEGPLLNPWGRYRAFRMNRYKYVRHFQDGAISRYLFDLEQDPQELVDLTGKSDYADTLREIEQSLESWNQQLNLPELGKQPSTASSIIAPATIAHNFESAASAPNQ
jgi:arylsulfatase A-like enzyme